MYDPDLWSYEVDLDVLLDSIIDVLDLWDQIKGANSLEVTG